MMSEIPESAITPRPQDSRSPINSPNHTSLVLEGAFVDPGYTWPPPEGFGKNAIELQASKGLLEGVDRGLYYPAAPKIKTTTRVIKEVETKTSSRCGFLSCCKIEESQVINNVRTESIPPDEREKERLKQEYMNQLKEYRKALAKSGEVDKYGRVPEGILVYRLDTLNQRIALCSSLHSNSNMDEVIIDTYVTDAYPAKDKSRRAITIVGKNGEKKELMACEQRTAIAWMEAIDMMLGRSSKTSRKGIWGKQNLNKKERDIIEEEYLNLTAYSNNLIRTGAIPGNSDKAGGASGIYYSVTKFREHGEDVDEEALESIAKRRAVIKDSWDFYRMICSLLRDRRKYDETFRRLQTDPVYPYLNSMTGLNDPGDNVRTDVSKTVIQNDLPEYADMTRTAVCKDLVKKAEAALPSLVQICKALAGSLGVEEVGVGPIKDISAAIRKADKKYQGDVLRVIDYCRALLVVKDAPTLLALLELARDSFGPLVRRVKLSSLKSDHQSLPGGYRDCKINLELKGHVCEIQIHLWPMWTVCGVDGFRHYRHCLEYSTDSFKDPYDALAGLDSKTVAELIVMAEEAVASKPLDNLEWFDEKYILDYFAEVGLFMSHELHVWAETTLRHLIRLRCESPDIGPDHEETLYLQKYLVKVLKHLGKKTEAKEIQDRIVAYENFKKTEQEKVTKSLWDSIFTDPKEAMDLIFDPTKNEREEEHRLRKEIKASKRAWRKIRQSKFQFLDKGNTSDNSVSVSQW